MRLAEAIAAKKDSILAAWSAQAQKAASARGLSQPELVNILPRYLDALSRTSSQDFGRLSDERVRMMGSQVSSRLRQSVELAAIVDELVFLEHCIVDALHEHMGGHPPVQDE